MSVAWAPRAIVCAITPFGLTGPNAGWRATPLISYAMGGYMSRVGPVEGPPVTLPGRQCWDEAGAHAAVAVLAALRVAGTVGPQGIDLSVHEILAGKDFVLEEYDAVGLNPLGRLVGVGWPPSGTYECVDGPFSVAAHQVRHWDAFLEMLELPVELADPLLQDPLVRRERYLELRATIAELVRDRSREDLVSRGQAAGLPCGILHRPTGFVADRQLAARGTFVATPTPWGEVPMPVPGRGSAPRRVSSGPVPRRPRPRRRRSDLAGRPDPADHRRPGWGRRAGGHPRAELRRVRRREHDRGHPRPTRRRRGQDRGPRPPRGAADPRLRVRRTSRRTLRRPRHDHVRVVEPIDVRPVDRRRDAARDGTSSTAWSPSPTWSSRTSVPASSMPGACRSTRCASTTRGSW